MRRWFVAFCLLGIVTQTNAQDFETPTLRGSSPYIPEAPKYPRWGGFYIGGQIGHNSTEMNFAGATEPLIAYILRETALQQERRPSEWQVLGKSNPTGPSYGLFAGYNAQWDNVIVGIDVHYNRSNFFASAPVTPITRATSAGGNTYALTIDGAASMRITDYGSARLRGGWAVGNFLPYATIGVALGRANVTRSARVSGAENPPAGYPIVPCNPVDGCVELDVSTSESKNAAFIYGWSAGAGVDVLVMPNVFLRGEFEFISFTRIQGIEAQMGTLRVGAGARF